MIQRIKNVQIVFMLTITAMLLTSSPARADTEYFEYYVLWGDTLSELSETHHQEIDIVADLNHIEDIDLIYAGSYLTFIQYTKNVEQTDTKKKDTRTEHVAEKKQASNTNNRVRNMIKENPYHISLLGGN